MSTLIVREISTPDGSPVAFPNGIRVLADYLHSKGLKLGIYTLPRFWSAVPKKTLVSTRCSAC